MATGQPKGTAPNFGCPPPPEVRSPSRPFGHALRRLRGLGPPIAEDRQARVGAATESTEDAVSKHPEDALINYVFGE